MKQVIESSSDLQRIEVCQGVFRSKRIQRNGDLDEVDDIALLSVIFLNYHCYGVHHCDVECMGKTNVQIIDS